MTDCKTLFKCLCLLTLLMLQATFALADPNSRALDHAPIGVMADHQHKQGEVMLSYRFMRMQMDGNRVDEDRVSTGNITGSMMDPGPFMVAPTEMTMDMHMLGAMYGASDSLTLMLMLPLLDTEMDHVTRMGAQFTTKTDGLGDIKVSGLIRLYERGAHKIHLNAGVSVPTGGIDERDDTPAMANAKLPYPMQLGSGSLDLLPGLTYNGQNDNWGWGAQLNAVLRLHSNKNDYKLGDRFQLTGWLARSWSQLFSTSLRIDAQSWDNIEGARSDLNPRMVQTANPANQGGDRIDLALGANLLLHNDHRFALEFSRPVYQSLSGPQLETDWVATGGWQYLF
ncbi:MAG: transporter [Pseudomonadales bacterium]